MVTVITMKIIQTILLAAVLALAGTSCNGHPKEPIEKAQGGSFRMPTAAPGQALIISSPKVNKASGRVGDVQFTEVSDLALSRSNDILVVSPRDIDSLRLISSNGEVRAFGARRPGQPGVNIATARSAVALENGEVLVFLDSGKLIRLAPNGSAQEVGTIDVGKDADTSTKLLLSLQEETLLVAGGDLWRIDLEPHFSARKVQVTGLSGAVRGAAASHDKLFIATEEAVLALRDDKIIHKWSLGRSGPPIGMAPRHDEGAWLVTEKGALLEIDDADKMHTRIQPQDSPRPCSHEQSTPLRELTLAHPSEVLQRGNQLYLTSSGIGCQWIVAVGLPLNQ